MNHNGSVRAPGAHRLRSTLLLGGLGALLAGTALAAGEASSQDQLTEVVVTAQFRTERLQETPIAITAMNAQMLEQRGAVDLVDAANFAPNVSLSHGSSEGNFGQMASTFIRGVGQSDPHFAVEPGVGTYVNDVYYGVTPGAVFQLLDVNRVEVLRGPQGTLSGKNSIGGSIKLYSETPGPETNGYAEMGYGSYNKLTGRAAGNLTLIDNTLYARVAVSAVNSNGYFDRLDYGCVTGTAPTLRLGKSCVLGTEGGQRNAQGRVSLRWIASDTVEDLLVADLIKDDSQNPAVKQISTSPFWAGTNNYITCAHCYTSYETLISVPNSGPSKGVPFSVPDTTPLDSWGISNKIDWHIQQGLKFESITAIRGSTVTLASPSDASPASITDQIWRLAHRQFTQELRLSGEYGHLLEWTAGLYYYDAKGDSGGRVNIPFGLAPGGGDGGLGISDDILFEDPVHTSSHSGFLHTSWHPVDDLTLIADGRYSKDTKKFTFNRWNALQQPNPAIPGLLDFPVSYSGSRFDYRAGIEYQWAPDVMSYAQVSTGYKGGGVNPRPYVTTQAITYSPETLTAYEAGIKSQFLDRHATVNLAAFYDKYKDFQGTLTRCDAYSPFPGFPCAMTTNVGDAHISGIELESQLKVLEGLSVDLSLGWLDFKYTSVNANTGVLLSDKNVFTPDFTASGGIQYQIPLGNGSSLTPRFDYSYHGQMYSNFVNDPTNRIPSVGLANLRLTWSDTKNLWSGTLAVTNLFDKFYFTSVNNPDGTGAAFPLFGTDSGTVGTPREVLVTVRRKFE